MNNEQYRDHCLALLARSTELIEKENSRSSEGDPLRELLWFIGGDCLHFMPDEEVE